MRQRSLKLDGIKNSVIPKSRPKFGENLNPHMVGWQQDSEVADSFSPSYLFRFCYPLSISACPSFFSFFFLLPLDCSHTNTRTGLLIPSPLCGLPTCSRGHGWLKQWQVDSTLKLSIDPRELNQTANPPSLSGRALGGTKGEDAPRARGQTPPLHPHCTLLKNRRASMEEFLTLWSDFQAGFVDSLRWPLTREAWGGGCLQLFANIDIKWTMV